MPLLRNMPPTEELSTPALPSAVSSFGLNADAAATLARLIAESVDPDSVTRYLIEFARIDADALRQAASDPERLEWLVTVFAFSRFLSEGLLRHPGWILNLSNVESVLTTLDYKASLSSFLNQRGVA